MPGFFIAGQAWAAQPAGFRYGVDREAVTR